MKLSESAQALNMLGGLFRFAPSSAALLPTWSVLRSPGWLRQWPAPLDDARRERLEQALSAIPDDADRQALFDGRENLAAPPWGSVYLDAESRLSGPSTEALRAFFDRNHIALAAPENEPMDHIGLMLWMAGRLASEQRVDALRELLGDYLLPWAPRYLDLLAQNSGAHFYTALAELTEITLQAVAERLHTRPRVAELHR